MARYVVEECQLKGKKVRNLMTLGSPNMGMESIPFCYKGFVCNILNHIAHRLSLWKSVQEFLPLAEILYVPSHMGEYKKKNKLIPVLNNQKNDFAFGDSLKESFTSINKAMFVKYDDDKFMYPKESAWFQQVDDTGRVVPLNESDYYVNDTFGLKTLVEEGRASFVTFAGGPAPPSEDDVTNIIIPFLKE